ncbi:MAG: nuclear transport factor 2 family protein [Imperialibacter sp.]|uniref:nuclear transport factor 2 family protein n=1 Tax=Imperialibacter sp. TaxID=2038411 RepID=UPI0032EF7886
MKTILIFFVITLVTNASQAQNSSDPVDVVSRQLDAYNARDIDKFLETYSDTVKIYNYPDKLLMDGIENLRKGYEGFFQTAVDLHCDIVNRTILGNTVIDHESVVFDKNKPRLEGIAIYKVSNGKIFEVRFINARTEP